MQKFNCRYAMYLDNKGVPSVIWGTDIIDAIKQRNQYAILVWIDDDEGNEYICKEHDTPGEDGHFNYYWVDSETGEVLYDENLNTDEPVKIVASKIEDTITNSGWIKPNGDFFECEYEGHNLLAEKMINLKMEPSYNKELDGEMDSWRSRDGEGLFESRGWTKLSSGKILFRKNPNKCQKEVIIDYFLSKGKNRVNAFGMQTSIEDFMNRTY